MIDLTPRAYAILRRQHGHVSVGQLTAAGVTRNARQRLVDGQALVEVHRGVLRVSSAPVTFEGHCVALCLAHPAGFISGPSAGRLMDVRRMPATTAARSASSTCRRSRNAVANAVGAGTARLRAPVVRGAGLAPGGPAGCGVEDFGAASTS